MAEEPHEPSGNLSSFSKTFARELKDEVDKAKEETKRVKWWLGINEYIWKLRVVLYSNFQRCVSKYISWLLKHQMLSVLSLITLSVSESQTTVANAYCNDIAFNIKKKLRIKLAEEFIVRVTYQTYLLNRTKAMSVRC